MKIKYPKPTKETEQSGIFNQLRMPVFILIVFFSGILVEQLGLSARLLNNVNELMEKVNNEALLYRESTLPTIYLDIPFDSMLAITEKRDEALRLGALFSEDEDFVPATMHMENDQRLDIKIRLKGDQVDHLQANKWSYRIHIKENDGAILGMRRFSLQAPYTRNYVHEWTFHQNLLMEGILTTRYDFVNLVVNGEHKGVYAIEESFSEDLLESQERREGVILRYEDKLMWVDWVNGGSNDQFDGFWITYGREVNEVVPYRSNHINQNETLIAQLKRASDLLYAVEENAAPTDQILDEELWGQFYALSDLWGASHSTIWHNTRLYYNPVTGLIEPIAYDGVPLDVNFYLNDVYYPYLHGNGFVSPAIEKAYVETLERITQPTYIDQLESTLSLQVDTYEQALLQEYTNHTETELIFSPWSMLRQRANLLAKSIHPAQPIRGNYHLTEDGNLNIDLVNLMILHVELREIRWGDETISLDEMQCSGSNCDVGLAAVQNAWVLTPTVKDQNATQLSFQLPLSSFSSPHTTEEDVYLYVNLYGGSKTFEIPIGTNYVPKAITQGMLPSASLDEALAMHSFLLELGDHQLGIAQGEWDVNTDLILPAGYSLSIPHGTTLRFGEGINFIVRGHVDLFGRQDAPITITSQNGVWGGMLVLKAEKTSTWEYVKVSDAHGISYPGMGITGGVTFYQSDIDIRNSQIGNNQTEDALNVMQSEFYFEKVEFLNAPSDAFDGDFVHGTISNCSFHDIGGDGVDVSGSRVTVVGSYFVSLGDKAVSAGEHSIVAAENLTIREVGIGVASKDLSAVTLNLTTIEGARVAGLAAYIKKPQYGAASITATDVEISDTPKPAFCQTKSTIVLNGENILAEDFDVDALYEQGVLGN